MLKDREKNFFEKEDQRKLHKESSAIFFLTIDVIKPSILCLPTNQ